VTSLDKGIKPNSNAYVSKCCKNGQVLDFENHLCVPMSDEMVITKPQNDFEAKFQQMSNNLKLDTTARFSRSCSKKEKSVLEKPGFIITNSSAFYANKVTKSFHCLDMVSKSGKLIGLFTLRCQNLSQTQPVEFVTEGLAVNFPKCCSDNQVLDQVNLECSSAYFNPFQPEILELRANNFTSASKLLRF
jgi:hypothetical protein